MREAFTRRGRGRKNSANWCCRCTQELSSGSQRWQAFLAWMVGLFFSDVRAPAFLEETKSRGKVQRRLGFCRSKVQGKQGKPVVGIWDFIYMSRMRKMILQDLQTVYCLKKWKQIYGQLMLCATEPLIEKACLSWTLLFGGRVGEESVGLGAKNKTALGGESFRNW